MRTGVRCTRTSDRAWPGRARCARMPLVRMPAQRIGEYRMDVAVTAGARGGATRLRLTLRDPETGQAGRRVRDGSRSAPAPVHHRPHPASTSRTCTRNRPGRGPSRSISGCLRGHTWWSRIFFRSAALTDGAARDRDARVSRSVCFRRRRSSRARWGRQGRRGLARAARAGRGSRRGGKRSCGSRWPTRPPARRSRDLEPFLGAAGHMLVVNAGSHRGRSRAPGGTGGTRALRILPAADACGRASTNSGFSSSGRAR